MTAPIERSGAGLESYMRKVGKNALEGSQRLRLAPNEMRVAALHAMADEIREAREEISITNQADMSAARVKGLSKAMLDRLMLDAPRIEAMALGLESIAAQKDPIGHVDENWEQPNGLKFSKVRVPIGVIGMIYESRPNVTADAAGLCIKSGNASILRGGSESARTNRAIHAAIERGLKRAGLPKNSVQMIDTTNREAVGHMLVGLNGHIDLIIPRGGKSLIERVQTDARVPVLAHLEGLCHTYVHKDADPDMAISIVHNAKLRRTGICGSTETLLIDSGIASTLLPQIVAKMTAENCELRGCVQTMALNLPKVIQASNEDFHTEHLAPILNIRIVEGLDEAIHHIAKYGSNHTDAIVTNNTETAAKFLRDVDSSIVMHNTSTQFADGGEFGFGAEIGIATGRLHARGPVGAQHLTTYKYTVQGSGQVRP